MADDRAMRRPVPTLIHDGRAWVPADEYDRLREALEQIAATKAVELVGAGSDRFGKVNGFAKVQVIAAAALKAVTDV